MLGRELNERGGIMSGLKLYVARNNMWDGNIKFYQYDKEQRLLITGIPFDMANQIIVEISNRKNSYSAMIEPVIAEDGLEFIVPDVYLDVCVPLNVFICKSDEDRNHLYTIADFRIPVIERKSF